MANKWEYHRAVLEPEKPREETERFLNLLGDEGWELIGVVPVMGILGSTHATTQSIQFFFKRSSHPKSFADLEGIKKVRRIGRR